MPIIPELLKSLPDSTGVYLMKNSQGAAIYIGKAKSIRHRVRSYFQRGSGDARPQIPYILSEITDLDYLVTGSEREALALENALIKKHKPKYNILLKDDKNYASLRLDPPRAQFAKLTYTRRVAPDGATYFGPFASGDAMRQTKRLIHRIFPLRDCSDEKFHRHRDRPCLNFHIKTCAAPCAAKINEQSYREIASAARLFLKGEIREVIKLLKKNMASASDDMRYEDAAHYRDQIKLLQKHLDVERLISASVTDKDIVGYCREGERVEFVVLFSRGGAIIDKAEYSFDKAAWEDGEILREFLERFYGGEKFIPPEILVPAEFEGVSELEGLLSEKLGRAVKIAAPKRGARVKLMELARRNAQESFKRKSRERRSESELLLKLRDSLLLDQAPSRIECFDISNTQGALAVASMVSFLDGKPDKPRYRKFRIKTVVGANDYGMLFEAISRRLKRANEAGWGLPGLMLIDGGKGQLAVAKAALEEANLEDNVAIASIAKGRDEGEIDKIYVPGRKNPLSLGARAEELLLLIRIRDEAHRFAITYHKTLRGRKALESELDSIPGIGGRRKELLLKRFGSIEGIKAASVEQISSLPQMTKKTAEELKRRLGYL
ncbi:MAG: excinuclease ABC subunit UvrC [Deltaproteobacteria bacterium]